MLNIGNQINSLSLFLHEMFAFRQCSTLNCSYCVYCLSSIKWLLWRFKWLLWSVGGVPQGSPRRGAHGGGGGGGGGAGRGGGDGSEGGVERLHDAQLQQQIILALRRLREDMRSVMDRLEVVERLAATHVSICLIIVLYWRHTWWILFERNQIMFCGNV